MYFITKMKTLISLTICLIGAGYSQRNDFIVNEETYQAHFVKDLVSASRDSIGNFVFVWFDTRSGVPGLYAQRMDRDGNLIGANFKINEDSIFNIIARRPDVSCDGAGKFVVIYEAGVTIYVRRFSELGIPLGPSFRIADTCRYGNPTIAASSTGKFTVTWSDTNKILMKRQIFAQRYDSLAQPIDTMFVVSDSGVRPNFPEISYDRNGNFVTIWANTGLSPLDIYCQIFDSLGNRIGPNIIVNDSGGLYLPYGKDLSLGHMNNNNFIVTWSGRGSRDLEIYGRIFRPNGQAIGCGFRVNDPTIMLHWPVHPSVVFQRLLDRLSLVRDTDLGLSSLSD